MSSLPLAETPALVPFGQAVGGAILVTAVIAAMPVVWMVVKRIYGGRNIFFARWGFLHLFQLVLLWLGLSLLVGGLLGSSSGAGEISILMALGASSVVYGASALLVMYWAHRLDPDGIRCLGFRAARSGRALLAGTLAYIAVLPGIMGLMQVWPYLLDRFGKTYEPQVFENLFETATGSELWVSVLLAVAVVPLFEELLFRSFLQPLLVQNFRDKGGVVLTAVIFAALHGESAFLPIFGLALLLGAVMLRTQRLLAVWSIHALHNGLQLLFLFSMPEIEAGAASGALLLGFLR